MRGFLEIKLDSRREVSGAVFSQLEASTIGAHFTTEFLITAKSLPMRGFLEIKLTPQNYTLCAVTRKTSFTKTRFLLSYFLLYIYYIYTTVLLYIILLIIINTIIINKINLLYYHTVFKFKINHNFFI
jgi:hypothetical protein